VGRSAATAPWRSALHVRVADDKQPGAGCVPDHDDLVCMRLGVKHGLDAQRHERQPRGVAALRVCPHATSRRAQPLAVSSPTRIFFGSVTTNSCLHQLTLLSALAKDATLSLQGGTVFLQAAGASAARRGPSGAHELALEHEQLQARAVGAERVGKRLALQIARQGRVLAIVHDLEVLRRAQTQRRGRTTAPLCTSASGSTSLRHSNAYLLRGVRQSRPRRMRSNRVTGLEPH
jgi:hypothetical protein